MNHIGYPLTNMREFVILILSIYLYINTKNILFKLMYIIEFITHIYKLYRTSTGCLLDEAKEDLELDPFALQEDDVEVGHEEKT